MQEQLALVGPCDLGRGVGGAVVDHDAFSAFANRLPAQRLQAPGQLGGPVVGADHDADVRSPGRLRASVTEQGHGPDLGRTLNWSSSVRPTKRIRTMAGPGPVSVAVTRTAAGRPGATVRDPRPNALAGPSVASSAIHR